MRNYFDVNVRNLILCATVVIVANNANAVNYTYKGVEYCSTGIVVGAATGVISCATGGTASVPQLHFSSGLTCPTGITIGPKTLATSTGAVDVTEVSCNTTLPSACTLTPSTAVVTPPAAIGLTANCTTNPATSYKWAHDSSLKDSVAGNITFPDSTPPGLYTYSVTGLDKNGAAGETATAYVTVKSPGVSGPFAYIAYQSTPPSATSAPAGKIAVLDLSVNKIISTFDVGTSPTSVVASPAGDRLYVTSQYGNTVSVINLAGGAYTKIIDVPVGKGPAGLAINPAGTKVYVANSADGTVSVIDTTSSTYPVKSISVGASPYGIAVNPAGTRVYITQRVSAGAVTVLDGNNNLVGSPMSVGSNPSGIAVNLEGSRVYVANNGSDSVSIIDTASNAVTSIAVGKSPYGLALNPAGTKVYVANQDSTTFSGTLSVIDVALAAVTDTVNVGKAYFPPTAQTTTSPSFIAFNASGSLAYVTNQANGTVSVVDTASNTVLAGSSTQTDPTVTVASPAPPSLWSFGQFIVADKPAFQGLWWNDLESGWGMSIAKHKNMMFAAVYTYDQVGNPTWYVMSSCPIFNISTSCTGDLYKVSGGTSPSVAWNGAAKSVANVGSGTLAFTDANNGTFKFTIDGVSGSKKITRQIFASGTTPPAVDHTDLWWNPNENGWGAALTQQYGTIFATWYAYDTSGKAIWYVASNCVMSANACTGDIYQVNGGSSLTTAWTGANKVTKAVGTLTITFTDASNGTMNYTINGSAAQKRDITRQLF